MAEFSKEYDQKEGMGFSDFSIKEIFDKLDEGFYISQICEGFGSLAVLKNKGDCYLAFAVEETGNIEWKKFDFETLEIGETLPEESNKD